MSAPFAKSSRRLAGQSAALHHRGRGSVPPNGFAGGNHFTDDDDVQSRNLYRNETFFFQGEIMYGLLC